MKIQKKNFARKMEKRKESHGNGIIYIYSILYIVYIYLSNTNIPLIVFSTDWTQ